MDDIRAWLDSIGLSQYTGVFEENEIDFGVLPHLDHEVLKDIGVKAAGHRVRILKASELLDSGALEADAVPEQVQSASESDVQVWGEAERRQLTVMFSDLVDSVELGERMDVEDYRDLLTRFRTTVVKAIEQFNGFVARHQGDGVLAYFGYPKADEYDAESAVRAGVEILRAVKSLENPYDVQPKVRLGIATGQAVVGDVLATGASAHSELAALGPTPNLAARLQGAAEPDTIVVSATTRRLVGDAFAWRKLKLLRLKGVRDPLQAYAAVPKEDFDAVSVAHRSSSQLTPLVGRQGELGLVLGRWEQAVQGAGQAFLVSAEAGVGKSRLVHEVRQALKREQFSPMALYCSPYHSGSALHPVIEAIRAALEFQRGDTPAGRMEKLKSWLGDLGVSTQNEITLLASLLSLPLAEDDQIADLTPEARRDLTLQILTTIVERVAAQQPVLFIVEDLHWSDPTTLELLSLILERIRSTRILAILTFRPEFDPPWKGHVHLTNLSLNHLTDVECRTLARQVGGGQSLSEELLAQVVARTDGVPLFVEELARMVLETAGETVAEQVPATLRDALTARLDRLGPAKEIAQTASVIGRRFSLVLLRGLTNLADAELDARIATLVSSGLIYGRGAPSEAQYEFKHALVQEAAYGSLLRESRRERHRQVAELLETDYPEVRESQPELIGRHFTEAERNDKGYQYWLMAGRRTGESSAHTEAIGHLRMAIAVLRKLPKTNERSHKELELHILLGAALQMVVGQNSKEVEQIYTHALALARELGSPTYCWPVLVGLWRVHLSRGEIDVTKRFEEELARLAATEDDPPLHAALGLMAGATAYWVGEPLRTSTELGALRAEQSNEAMQALTLRTGLPVNLHAIAYSALSQWQLGFPERGAQQIRESIAVARTQGRPYELATTLFFGSFFHAMGREDQLVRTYAEECVQISSEHHFSTWLSLAQSLNGWAHAVHGNFLGSIEEITTGTPWKFVRTFVAAPVFVTLWSEVYEGGGDHERALSELRDARTRAEECGVRLWQAEIIRREGQVLSKMEGPSSPQASACFQEALEIARGQGAKLLELRAGSTLARLMVEQGRAQEARKLLAPIYDWFSEGFNTPDLRAAKAILDGRQ